MRRASTSVRYLLVSGVLLCLSYKQWRLFLAQGPHSGSFLSQRPLRLLHSLQAWSPDPSDYMEEDVCGSCIEELAILRCKLLLLAGLSRDCLSATRSSVEILCTTRRRHDVDAKLEFETGTNDNAASDLAEW